MLLSAGVNFEIFKKQLEIACRAGASGFVAGRAIWKEAATLGKKERIDFLKYTSAKRAEELVAIVHEYAVPWRKTLIQNIEKIDKDWIERYQNF